MCVHHVTSWTTPTLGTRERWMGARLSRGSVRFGPMRATGGRADDDADAAERGTAAAAAAAGETPRRVVVRTMRAMPKPGAGAVTTEPVVMGVDVDVDDDARVMTGTMTSYRRSPTSSSAALDRRASAVSGTRTTRTTACERFCETQLGVAYDKLASGVGAHGELGVQALVSLFVCATRLPRWRRATANTSVCGYMEIVPNAFALAMTLAVAGATDSAFWGAATASRAETTSRALKCARVAIALVPALALVGCIVVPRCLWWPHQDLVFLWARSATIGMACEWAMDTAWFSRAFRRGRAAMTRRDSVLAQLTWVLGVATSNRYYRHDGTSFYKGEYMMAMGYAWWTLQKHRAGTYANQPAARTFTLRHLFFVDGLLAVIMLSGYRYLEYNVCSTHGTF